MGTWYFTDGESKEVMGGVGGMAWSEDNSAWVPLDSLDARPVWLERQGGGRNGGSSRPSKPYAPSKEQIEKNIKHYEDEAQKLQSEIEELSALIPKYERMLKLEEAEARRLKRHENKAWHVLVLLRGGTLWGTPGERAGGKEITIRHKLKQYKLKDGHDLPEAIDERKKALAEAKANADKWTQQLRSLGD